MLIYIILIFLIFISAYIFRKNKKIFCILSGIVLWLLLAFRNISMGLSDTENVYYPFFQMIINMDLKNILQYQFMADKGFYFVMKIISLLTSNYQICIAILAIPFIFLIMKGIYKDSDNAFLSIIIFISLYYAYGFFLLRQAIAIGIIFCSYKYIKEKNLFKFICTIILASVFHKTALIFLIAYPFCNYIKYGYKNYIMILACYIFGKYIFNILIPILNKISIFERYSYSLQNGYYTIKENFSIWGLVITVLILCVSGYFYKKSKKENNNINVLLNLSTLGSIFYCFTPVLSEAYRVALYFSIFNILLLSNTIKYYKDYRTIHLIKFVIIILFVGYFFIRTIFNTNIYPYIFYK